MFRRLGDLISSKDDRALGRTSLNREPSVWTIEENSVCYMRKMHLEQLLDDYYKGHVQILKEARDPLSRYNAVPEKSLIDLSLKTITGEQRKVYFYVKLLMEERDDLEKRSAAYLRLDVLTKMKKEILMYKVVIATVEKFQKHYNVSDRYLYGNMFAKCIALRMTMQPPPTTEHLPDCFSAIILDRTGYHNPAPLANEQRGYDRVTTTMILRQMARFHACPIAMRLKKGTAFRETILPILYLDVKDYAPVPSDEELLQELISDRLKNKNLRPPHLDNIRISQQLSRLYDWIYYDGIDETWYTICHTKYGIPNILITRGDRDAPGPSRLLEMWNFSYNSCCTDLAYFIYTSVNTDTLGKCLEEMLQEYFNEFKITLDKYQLSSEFSSIYSYKRFKSEFKAVEKRIFTKIVDALNDCFKKESACKGSKPGNEQILEQDYSDRITYVLTAYSR